MPGIKCSRLAHITVNDVVIIAITIYILIFGKGKTIFSK